jgi:3-dehydrosphinganine reductase
MDYVTTFQQALFNLGDRILSFTTSENVVTAYIILPIILIVLSLLLTMLYRCMKLRCCTKSVDGRLVLITGGSSGIGKALACKYAAMGASVVIVARTESKLEQALEEIEEAAKNSTTQSFAYLCCDVTNKKNVELVMDELIDLHGCPDTIINCHGAAYPGYFLEQDHSIFEKTMALNYMGNVNVIKTIAPQMAARGSGEIVIVASAAAVVSFIGYTSYSPSKFALRGLSDALRNELSPFGIRVSIAYPPDTNTTGFKKEKEMAPPETAACFPADPFESEAVANAMIDSIRLGDYHLQSPDPLQNLLISSMSGVTPRPYVVLETLLAPLLLVVEQLFWPWFDYQARCYKQSDRAPSFVEINEEEEEEENTKEE